jgi:hypothetical protein
LLLASFVAGAPARAQPAGGRARVSVQPIEGERGPAVRDQIARLLKGHGFAILTSVPRVAGTGQYLTFAKDHKLTAFISADLEEGHRRDSVTFLLWDGATGSVQGRWTVSAPSKKLGKAIAKGFWKYFGPRFEGLEPPPSDELEPADPMYVNAGTPLD